MDADTDFGLDNNDGDSERDLRAAKDDDTESVTVLTCEDADTDFCVGNNDGDSERDLRAAEDDDTESVTVLAEDDETESATVLTCEDAEAEKVTVGIEAEIEGSDVGVRFNGEDEIEVLEDVDGTTGYDGDNEAVTFCMQHSPSAHTADAHVSPVATAV
jgi:hypothetical protein